LPQQPLHGRLDLGVSELEAFLEEGGGDGALAADQQLPMNTQRERESAQRAKEEENKCVRESGGERREGARERGSAVGERMR